MSYDFRELKTISVADGEVALRIPKRWRVWPDKERNGYWGCYEEGDADTGTLWIEIDRFEFFGEEDPPMSLFGREEVERMAEKRKTESPPPLENSVAPVNGGCCWHLVFDGEENGEPLRFWFSRFFLGQGASSAVISFNFVLTHDQMDRPEFVHLRETMDREIRGAFLDPFRDADQEGAEKIFGPLKLFDFADQVRLVLPQAMTCSPNDGADGAAGNQWYCRLDTQTSHAGMFVFLDEFPFSEDDATAMENLEARLAEKLSEPADPSLEHAHAQRAPRGTVLYEVHDDDEADLSGDPDDPPLRNHVWTYIHDARSGPRRLQVLLMIPVPEIDAPPFPQLVRYMNGAVRRAQFPDAD